MKIAQIVCAYPPYYGGMGNVVFNLASGLTARGHEVEVITPQYETKEDHLAIQDLEDYGKRLKPVFQWGKAAYLPQIAKELDRFDLVHLHYPFFGTANLVRRWKTKHPEKPLVVTYHMDTRAQGVKGLIFKYYSRFWLPRILSAADLLLVSSFDYLRASQASSLYQCQPEKWRELPLGVDIERFCPRQKPVTWQLVHGLDQNLPTLLFVGGMDQAHYFKGVKILLQAMYLLKKQGKKLQVVLVGDGDLRPDYELFARSLGITDLVRFVGQVSDDELPDYYNLADLFVLPSTTVGEAFGLVLLEAMASGVPVLAADLPGVRLVAQEGGKVFPVGQSVALAREISAFLAKESVWLAKAAQARMVVEEKYVWSKIIRDLEMIYTQLL